MSRFLKERHYSLVLPAIRTSVCACPTTALPILISLYLEETNVSFTQQDVTEIEVRYYRKYSS